MKRIKFYVNHCTVEERDRGKDNTEQFDTEAEARKRYAEISNDEFKNIEKRHEIYDRWQWLPNWDMGEDWSETIEN